MTKPAFFVDGHMEKKIVQKLCPNATIRRLDTNGDSVQMSAIAKKVAAFFELLDNRCHPIVVLIDKEGRRQSCTQIIEQLKKEMQSFDLPLDQFHIGVCDRMIENWIIADKELLKERFEVSVSEGDGDHGKSVLKRLFGPYSPYQETVDGVDLFTAASAKRIAECSPSFAAFIDGFPVDCYWLNM